MTAFLILEDNKKTREYLAGFLHQEFPDARIDQAGNLADAIACARDFSLQGGFYDVSLLDVYLPRDGSGGEADLFPEYREKLIGKLGGYRAVVINYSIDADNEEVRQLLRGLHNPDDPACIPIPALPGTPWHREVLRVCRRTVYGRRIRDEIDQMLQSARGEAVPMAGVSGRFRAGAGGYCGTQNLGALMRDIKLHWNDLDENLRDHIREVFNIRQVGDEILVNL